MDLKKLGAQIISSRKALGWSQDELINRSKVARGALQELEKGRGNPTVGTLEALADSLGTPLLVCLGTRQEAKLLELLGRANERNAGLILGYAQGLLDAHQSEPRGRKTSD